MSFGAKLVGQNALDLVSGLACHIPGIKAVHFATVPLAPLHDQRATLDDADRRVTQRAKELREEIRLPFWDGIMLATPCVAGIAQGVLSAAAFHQTLSSRLERVLVSHVTLEWLTKRAQDDARSGRLLILASRVETADNAICHIPLLDFHCAYSDHGTEVVAAVIRLLGQKGVILSSGKSYHFYGSSLLSAEQMRVFLGKALLFAPITDRTWIGHQLIEGCCALRISGREDYGGPPVIVSVV